MCKCSILLFTVTCLTFAKVQECVVDKRLLLLALYTHSNTNGNKLVLFFQVRFGLC